MPCFSISATRITGGGGWCVWQGETWCLSGVRSLLQGEKIDDRLINKEVDQGDEISTKQ